MILYVLLGGTTVICFICNLAVSHRLDWFFVAAASVLLGISILFLPFLLQGITAPRWIKNCKALLYFMINSVLVLVLIIVMGIYAPATRYWETAIPITLLGLIYPWAVFLLIRYMRGNPFLKAGAIALFSGIYYGIVNDCITWIVDGKFEITVQKANFFNWANERINSNVTMIILVVLLTISIVCTGIGVLKERERQDMLKHSL